jgi:predicted AAA+ superfamily ATPase
MSASLYPRHLQRLVEEALDYSPAVFVMGARQVGKSTLAEQIVAARGIANAISLDSKPARDAALGDPVAFVANLEGPAFIDEIQHAPELLLAIKQDIDRRRRPGRFLLTGSANILTAPRVHDALTGRTALLTLWPLAQSEIERSTRNVVDSLFEGDPPQVQGAPVGRAAFVERVTRGGYPQALSAPPAQRRRIFADYLISTLTRDLRDIADVRKLDEMPRLLRLLASRAGNLLVIRNVASALGLTHETAQTYTRLLETVFLVRTMPAWRPGVGSREIQTPKVYLVDTGLLANILGADDRRVAEDDQLTGKLLENFAAMEIAKHVDWAETPATQYHYRDRRDEVDIVLEASSGALAAIEIKARATVGPRDWRPIAKLRDARERDFRCGVVLYTGERTLPLSDRIWAVPISGLWAS